MCIGSLELEEIQAFIWTMPNFLFFLTTKAQIHLHMNLWWRGIMSLRVIWWPTCYNHYHMRNLVWTSVNISGLKIELSLICMCSLIGFGLWNCSYVVHMYDWFSFCFGFILILFLFASVPCHCYHGYWFEFHTCSLSPCVF